jgi:hypothetical protein
MYLTINWIKNVEAKAIATSQQITTNPQISILYELKVFDLQVLFTIEIFYQRF